MGQGGDKTQKYVAIKANFWGKYMDAGRFDSIRTAWIELRDLAIGLNLMKCPFYPFPATSRDRIRRRL